MASRASLPAAIMAVPVTLSLLVEARGATEEDRIADAKEQARKWGGKATREVGEPKEMK